MLRKERQKTERKNERKTERSKIRKQKENGEEQKIDGQKRTKIK